jgi:nucleoside-diphosphate-sugar epimerase
LNHGLVPFTNLVTLLADRPETRLVYLSSSTVYGNFTKDVVDETDLCAPFGMYAVLKHCGEQILNETALHSDLNYSVVRPSALYGERCISRRVSQIFLENAFAGRPLIFRGDVSERLDFTYILDLCEGLMLAGTQPAAKSEVFNITRGASRPVVDLVEILRDYFSNLNFKIEDRDQATPKRGTLSNTKALNLLGFKPKYDLDVAYRNYIEWYVNRAKKETMRFNNISQVNE